MQIEILRDSDPLNNSSYGQAATQQVPGSIHQYVTGAREESQRTHRLKYDGEFSWPDASHDYDDTPPDLRSSQLAYCVA